MIDYNANILLIYTGGTIGMVENNVTGALEVFDFGHLTKHLPELQRFRFHIETIVFEPIIDSSDVSPVHWKRLVKLIEENYDSHDGFVILHGTDTMAYSASALSFMIENLQKPIVFTGAQLPIGKLRTDAKENLITAMEIAADKDSIGNPVVPEVCIFFQNYLLRGNRSTKVNADNFNAFASYNYPILGKSGIHIRYDQSKILKPDYEKRVRFHYLMDSEIVIFKLFPGINQKTVEAILNAEGVKAVVLETYGSGNAPRYEWFIEALQDAVKRGLIIVNITQCEMGCVEMQRYETGRELLRAGVVSGYDATVEATIAKLMYLLGHKYSREEIIVRMRVPLAGEMTRFDEREI
ncbi:asparaginase [Dysgonomonas macrotermitis]|uniref:asparaginase n=1 Tax=Dysgonomonas macrotermitis TaxID=1346286 RepID=A0A1M4WP38_9BACT|nr:type I asparaginase [Dysgonomonas macrotermitis]SHE82940.1 L-asparaginase [Dysgonomonas macrotermitis]